MNFKDISGISDINKIPIPTLNKSRKTGFKIYKSTKVIPCSIINGRDEINNAFAGVGSPIKFSDCLTSMLNLASLRAENIAMIKAE